jgi:predicted house-cleaning noncanonical NTP pyrophosphatase (MazG superfamily)
MENKKGKLVRDRIPQIIEAAGKKPIIRILKKEEFLEELDKKLLEEIDEFKEARSLEELADILEVLLAQCKAYGYDTFDLYKVNAEKRQARGSFNDKIFWSGNYED